MPREGGDDLRGGTPEARSELLRSQLRRFTDQVAMAGKTAELFELEMWLRSFERFFRIGAQPLSERETRALAARNWSEELRLVDNALLRVVQLSTSILSEEQVDLARFDRYVESSLNTEDGLDPYIEKYMNPADLDDIHPVYRDLMNYGGQIYGLFDDGDAVHRFALHAGFFKRRRTPGSVRFRTPSASSLWGS